MQALDSYLRQVFDEFAGDPADSDYQRGYLSAMIEIAKMFEPDLDISKVEAQTKKA